MLQDAFSDSSSDSGSSGCSGDCSGLTSSTCWFSVGSGIEMVPTDLKIISSWSESGCSCSSGCSGSSSASTTGSSIFTFLTLRSSSTNGLFKSSTSGSSSGSCISIARFWGSSGSLGFKNTLISSSSLLKSCFTIGSTLACASLLGNNSAAYNSSLTSAPFTASRITIRIGTARNSTNKLTSTSIRETTFNTSTELSFKSTCNGEKVGWKSAGIDGSALNCNHKSSSSSKLINSVSLGLFLVRLKEIRARDLRILCCKAESNFWKFWLLMIETKAVSNFDPNGRNVVELLANRLYRSEMVLSGIKVTFSNNDPMIAGSFGVKVCLVRVCLPLMLPIINSKASQQLSRVLIAGTGAEASSLI
ncbi:hypothetical protein OGAPHI_003986 [Ogataea philodendri]|uniref:Uncharacterized protein n=1 Tax=Ogataea philodendri TaxID=1378263 RepID=A0A9P8P4S7_9ASCO|nr:uncharacterized protein OGAPHI_003986 [Ogataea philodendri]KAH3665798.1 hypothetical protein OGAPHI_003986 [Ogataea philodendri]